MDFKALEKVFKGQLKKLEKIAKNKENMYRPMQDLIDESILELDAAYEKETGEKFIQKPAQNSSNKTEPKKSE